MSKQGKKGNLAHTLFALEGLCAYQDLRREPIMEEYTLLLRKLLGENREYMTEIEKISGCLQQYAKVFHLLRTEGFSGFGEYFYHYLRFQPTLFGEMICQGRVDPALENAASREIALLCDLAKLDCDQLLEEIRLKMPEEYHGLLGDLPRWSSHCPFDFETLSQFYQQEGCGKFAQHGLFLWQNDQLRPVEKTHGRDYASLWGYELQREQVYRNTEKLVAGHPTQNILLFGQGGTGKSAVVKSMVFEPRFSNLRLIQVEHDSLRSLPSLMGQLVSGRYKFILFIDDLAFDADDNTFSALKSILQGGLETPPENVVVYATSNRRHLVRQTFSERAGEEVDMYETISEKTALSERFGLRIPYLSMKKEEYLSLVERLYQEELEKGILPHIPKEELFQKAMTWEIRHGGRTPRVAQQFVSSIFI